MSIGISLSRSKHWTSLFVLLFILSCSSEKSRSINLEVKPQLTGDEKQIILDFSFSSAAPQSILIHWDALSVYEPSFEKDGLLKNDTELNEIVDSLKYTQFVIENQNNEKRFFSDIQLFEGETMGMKSIFSFDKKIDTLDLAANKKTNIKSKAINVNRLKINETDSKIRIHYLFRPSAEQKSAGYKSFVLASNWFKLP